MRRSSIAGLLCLVALAPVSARAIDVWDLSGADGNSGTDNELANGSAQTHDLQNNAAVADQDWYLVGQLPYSSYEVIVDGLTEEVAIIPTGTTAANALQVDLVDSGGTLINSGYAFSSIGAARTLRFRNATSTELTTQYVRVMSGANGCTTTCSTNAEYRIQLRETTLMAPRFNNSGGQVTVVMLQNSAPIVTGSPSSVAGTVRFWNAAGTLLASQNVSLPANGGVVLNTSTVTGAGGASGFVTFDHLGRYGQITGKAVALEPATGFTFDTAFVPKFY
jgi:hypothetical protein